MAAIGRMVSAHGGPRATRSETGVLNEYLELVVRLACCGDDVESLRERCRDFRSHAPGRIAAWLREAAHTHCGLLSAFSTAAGTVVTDPEAVAVRGELNEAGPVVERLETIAQELILGLEDLSLEALRRRKTTPGS